MPGARVRIAAAVCLLAGIAACGPKRIELPTGTGTPFAGAAAAYAEAIADCRTIRTMTATLRLSGRAGAQRLRGTLDAGFEAPARVRLEMRPPIGRPVFVLAAADSGTTLYLPRDHRVLRHESAGDVVEALVGLSLDGAELRALVSGCGFGEGTPTDGREFGGGWVTVETGATRTYLRRLSNRWRIAAAMRSGLTVHYGDFADARPGTVRLQSPPAKADITARVSDVSLNVTLEPAVFTVDVPADAAPLTLDELRQAGPLGER